MKISDACGGAKTVLLEIAQQWWQQTAVDGSDKANAMANERGRESHPQGVNTEKWKLQNEGRRSLGTLQE